MNKYQKDFLSKYIFKMNFKSNNITEKQKDHIGISLYKICYYLNLNKNKTRDLIMKWFYRSNYNNFNDFYNKIISNNDNKPLTTSEFYKTMNNLGISNSKYQKLRDSFYTKRYLYNKLIESAINHVMYENERIEKEIVEMIDYQI